MNKKTYNEPYNGFYDEEKTASWLADRIAAEAAKPDGEEDAEVIEECAETLGEIVGRTDDRELDERFRRVMSRAKECERREKRVRALKRTGLIAACAALFLTLGVVSAYAFVPQFRSYMNVSFVLPGEGIEFTSDGMTKYYKNIDDLMKMEGLYDKCVIVPKDTPSYLSIKSISFDPPDEGSTEGGSLYIKLKDNTAGITVRLGTDFVIDEEVDGMEKVSVNGLDFYVERIGPLYRAIMIDRGNVYTVSAPAQNLFNEILECMHQYPQ